MRMDEGRLFALFAGYPIPEHEMVDIAISVIGQTGLFASQYEQWHERPAADKTWTLFCTFWKDKIKLKRDTNINASQFGFGGNAEADEAVDAEYENSVANFANAHNATQTTIQNLTSANAQLQQQMQMMSMQLANMANSSQQQQWQPPNGQGGYSGGGNGKKKKKKRAGGANGWTGYGQQQQPGQQSGQRDRPANVKNYNNNNFCWTHGHDVADMHTSMSCKNPHCNHQVNATKQNPMGGNPAGIERTIWPQNAGYAALKFPRRGKQQQPQQQQQQQQWQPTQQTQFGGNAMQFPM